MEGLLEWRFWGASWGWGEEGKVGGYEGEIPCARRLF